MADVFISYSRVDKAFVHQLHEALKNTKREVWVDWEDIPLTADWWAEICSGIESADTFVFVITPDSIRSQVCRDEIEHAVRHRKRFIPILYRDIDATEHGGLAHPAISTHNWIMFQETVSFDDSFKSLLEAVDTDLAHVRMHTRLLVRAKEWEARGKEPSYLLDGSQIHEAEAWLTQAVTKSPEATDLHTEYILSSRHAQSRRQRQLLAAVLIALIVAIGLAIFGLAQSQIARSQANRASTQERAAIENAAIAENSAATALAAQGTAVAEAQRAATQQQIALAAAGTATHSLGLSQQRGTLVAQQVELAQQAQGTALSEAQRAATQQQIAVDAAATATHSLGFSEQRGTEVAVQADIAQQAQGTAIAEANFAATQEQAALNAAATATNALGISEQRGTQVAEQAELAQQAQGTALAEAQRASRQEELALNAAATATNALGISERRGTEVAEQAATAAQLLELSQDRGTQVAVQAELAQQAQGTAVAEAEFAAAQQQLALNSAATATALLGISEDRGTQVAVQAEIAQQAQGTAVAEAEFAATQQQLALNSAATATALLGISEDRGTQVAVQAELAQQAQGTAVAEAEFAAAQQQLALNNAATAIAAQATAEYSAILARSQSLAVSAEQAIANGNYDLALALALESSELNPGLVQSQRILNQIVYNSPRFSFPESRQTLFSPDMRYLLYTAGSSLILIDVATWQEALRLEGHTDTVLDADFSPDSQVVLSGSADSRVIVWDLATGLPRHVMAGHSGPVVDVEFSPDGTRAISTQSANFVIAWDVASGQEARRYEGVGHPIARVQYGEAGRSVFGWTPDAIGLVAVWNADNGSLGTVSTAFNGFDALRRNALIGGQGNTLILYDAVSRAEVRRFSQGFDWSVDRAGSRAFSPVGNQILVGISSADGTRSRLVLLDIATGAQVREFDGEAARNVNGLAFNGDGSLAISGFGSQLVIWNVALGQEIRRLSAHNARVESVSFSPDGVHAISRAINGDYRVWDITTGETVELGRIQVQTQIPQANDPGISPDGFSVYTGVWTDLFTFNLATGQQTGRIYVGDEILSTIYSPAQPHALTISENVAILWNMVDQTRIRFIGAEDDIFSGQAAFSADGSRLIIEGNGLYFWNLAEGRRELNLPKTFVGSGESITSLAVSPDNLTILAATGRPDVADALPGALIAFDAVTGLERLRFNVQEHQGTINDVRVSPDGAFALTASDDDTLILWDMATGERELVFVGHRGDVNVALFSADGSTILSASDDTTLILWDASSGQPIRRYTGHSAPVTGLALRGDGRLAVSATGGDTIIVWQIEGLRDVVDWTQANRYVYPLTCSEREQFNVEPLCDS
jgi:WD40 repeat protein